MSKKRDKAAPVERLKEPIWEQQRYEPPSAFGQFQLFRDMGNARTQAIIASEIGIRREAVHVRATKWRWKERAEAWDRHLDSIKTKVIEEAAKTMATRQAKLGMILQDKAVAALENIDLIKATARDVVALAEGGVKIERLARGEKTGEEAALTIMLPSLPSWAKGSKFVIGADIQPPQLAEIIEATEVINDSKAQEAAAPAARKSD